MKRVVIITRTKNRPMTLRRTLNSIAAQSFKDYKWVVINDGGSIVKVNEIIDEAERIGIDSTVLHNEHSMGMEASSNYGITNSLSKYIAFLDDDDTWHPEFLRKTVAFLDNPSNLCYRGVVTNTLVVEEKFLDTEIISICSYPFAPELDSVTLFHLARRNYIANLSFVYHRDALETIGLYREDYPVVGDWEFNLRFLREFDIGFIPEYLANCHRRSQTKGSSYNQSDINNIHSKYCAILRNELLRQDLSTNSIGLGFVANIAHEIDLLERTIRRGSPIYISKNIAFTIYKKLISYYKILSHSLK
ncbi:MULTISPECIES: glycosyltransferase family 2 protein [Methylomonas]|uniref:glycosyltransferase family 2 protein n=1 Tax=Methylomonas TaxID=416 RepID=UPI0009EE0091|nr:glycosyltransferase [Methylomonas koyamae]